LFANCIRHPEFSSTVCDAAGRDNGKRKDSSDRCHHGCKRVTEVDFQQRPSRVFDILTL